MKPEIESPFTDGKAILKKERKTREFRKDSFEITQFYYQCQETGQEFTTDELDQVNVNQIYNQYREKHGVPFPDEIRRIREKYDVSARKMSIILGLGVNSYGLYEQGEIPSVPNGRIILAANDPEEFQKNLDLSCHLISKKEYEKYSRKAKQCKEEEEQSWFDQWYLKKIFKYIRPNHFTGFRTPDLTRTAQMIAYFSGNTNKIYKTNLNKLLFYCDFLHFRNTGYSISGNIYRAIDLGPVPINYDKLYEKLADDGLIAKLEEEFPSGNYGTAYTGKIPFDEKFFSDSEKAVMDQIIKIFGTLTSKAIVDKSHQEVAWQACKESHQEISYQEYGFEIQANSSNNNTNQNGGKRKIII